MSVASEITRIQNNISSAYTALDGKGATLPQIQNSANLANTIESIPTGSGGVTTNPALKLIDWEGTVLQEYSKSEALALEALPAPSTFSAYSDIDHEWLVFQEWNWSLANIKTWVQNHEGETLLVGAIYTTTDGQDHNYWASPRGEGVLRINKQKRGTTSIGNNDFYDCHILTSINIPDGVTDIGDSAFGNCYSLTSINIPDSVTSIGDEAFRTCLFLTSINIPDGVTDIGDSAFQYCHSLTSINIPDGVTDIGDMTFSGCYSLKSINIPNSVTSIGDDAFSNCDSLKSINIPNSVTSIGSHAFANSASLVSINIPDGVTSIEDGAFHGCYSLTSINIPNSVTSIGDSAFQYCYSLTSINIPDGVTSIGDSAFQYCYSLTSINIPDSVTSIGDMAFLDCLNLFDILLEGKPAFPDFNVFAGVPSTVKIYVPRENLSWFEAITDGTDYYSIFVAIEDNIEYLESIGFNVDAYKEAA